MAKSRRKFIKESSFVATGLAVFPSIAYSEEEIRGRLKSMLIKLSKINDKEVDEIIDFQINNPGDRWHGGMMNRYEIPNAHSTRSFIVSLGTAYASPHSKYYLSEKLEKPLKKAIQCLLNVQHDDGTIDLYSTNFHSPPDTAFIVNDLSSVYANIKRLNRSGMKTFVEKTESFFKKSGECFLVGGIHTPNHRWVVSAALARLYSFFPSEKYLNRIGDWLAEGIDLDPDGQYHEKSVAIYSPVCNNMFLTMGRLLKRKDLMDVARKNLDMTLYYIQPGGEVLTEASGRQDAAHTGYVNRYYYSYLYFAIEDKNPAYSAVCQLIEQEMPELVVSYLSDIMELPIFEEEVPPPSIIPDNYFKRFSHSGVFRIRRGKTDISVIENNPTFFTFMKGNAVLQSIRLSATFFGRRGQFIPEKAETDREEIILTKRVKYGYFQPYPEELIPGDGDYSNLPREKRELSEAQTMNYKVIIAEKNGKVTMDVEINGTDNVPVSMEMSFRYGGVLSGVLKDKNEEDLFFLEEGMGKYKVGEDIISFGPGLAAHKYAIMRGMLPKQNANSVFITGYTPFKHTLELS